MMSLQLIYLYFVSGSEPTYCTQRLEPPVSNTSEVPCFSLTLFILVGVIHGGIQYILIMIGERDSLLWVYSLEHMEVS